MKHISKIISGAFLALFALAACSDKEEIIFEHEKPQFETKSNAILIEVIVPQTTQYDDEVYILGAFNGEKNAIGNLKYKLTPSETSAYKWGVYLYEEDFAGGKTLADGYYFYSENEGYERTSANEEPKHTETARYGERVDVRVAQWETYFEKPVVWPPVPSNMIMLRLTLPKYTPAGGTVIITGIINNQGCDYETGQPNLNETLSDWGSIKIDNKHHYLLIDPNKMYEANALGRSFRFCLIPDTSKPDWQDNMYDHQENKDGSDAAGDVYKLPGAETGMAYDFEIANWRLKSVVQTY